MRWSFSSLLAVPLSLTGCFNPSESPTTTAEDTDGTETEGASMTNTTPGSASETETASGGSMTPGTQTASDSDSDSDSDSESDSGAVCGDGEVNGDETCDDGVNDGSYGSCLDDCSAPAAFCGDGEVNGDEACDDGVNDGAYGGCAPDCAAPGPFCGDDAVNGDEDCDNGDDNENASGCNVDCTVSGSVQETVSMDGLSFCDGEFVTTPIFRDNGNVLVAASGYCDEDSLVLAELTSDLELEEDYGDDVLLPGTPVEESAMLGDAWLLSHWQCNYLVDDTAALTEVCEDRVQGTSFLGGVDDSTYYALDFDTIARFSDGSPSLGDAPEWSVVTPDNGTYNYGYRRAAVGPAGSVFVVGSRQLISNGSSSSYVVHLTAGGNEADSRVDGVVQWFDGVVYSEADDSIVLWTEWPDYSVRKYNSNLNEAWNAALPANGDIDIGVDSVGDIVVTYRDMTSGLWVMRKLSSDGLTERWSNPDVPGGSRARLAITEEDDIIFAAVGYNGTSYELNVSKIAP